MQLFRYPGGKGKLIEPIARHLRQMAEGLECEYREPFFGGGAVGLKMMTDFPRLWLNDRDPGIACLWESVIHSPESLKAKVMAFKPNVADFEEYKQFLLASTARPTRDEDVIEYAFRKLVVHQTSFSGLGTMAGGPLGGKDQQGPCKIDGRWSAERLCTRINAIHQACIGRHVRVTNGDFQTVIADTSRPAIIYLDPPYVGQGNVLYQCGFTHQDHQRLAELLKATPHGWLLSYDDCREVRELYSWATIQTVSMRCTISQKRDRKTELLISRKGVAEALGVEVVIAA